MIQNISPHTFSNEHKASLKIQESNYVFLFKEKSLLLINNNGKVELPKKGDFTPFKSDPIFLFTIDGVSCFLVLEPVSAIPSNMKYYELNSDTIKANKLIDWLSAVAYQLNNWYTQNKFCGRCGTATQFKNGERSIVCSACNHTQYPNIAPAIIVAIFSNNKILLARGVNFKNNMYSLIAGYVDVGESIEETVAREVKEEVGIDITNIRYYGSQPWPFSGSMMIGFLADGNDNQAIKVDESEIIDAAWFTRDNLPPHPTDRSIAGEIINKFVNKAL